MQLGIWQAVTRGPLKVDRHEYPSSWICSAEISSKTKVVADFMEEKATMVKKMLSSIGDVPNKWMMSRPPV